MNDVQYNVDFTYNGWNPNIKIWRAGESFTKKLPYITMDFLPTQDKRFASLGDAVGKIDQIYYEYAYCETELVHFSVFSNKYQNNRQVNARDFCFNCLFKIRERILSYWKDILFEFNASIDRGFNLDINDVSGYRPETGVREYNYDMSLLLRTDVRWNNKPPGTPDSDITAKKAYVELEDLDTNQKTNLRVIFNG